DRQPGFPDRRADSRAVRQSHQLRDHGADRHPRTGDRRNGRSGRRPRRWPGPGRSSGGSPAVTLGIRWTKALRDFTGYRGRALALFIALSVRIFTVSTMHGAYGIVSRKIAVHSLSTNPASATIEVDYVTPSVITTARLLPC